MYNRSPNSSASHPELTRMRKLANLAISSKTCKTYENPYLTPWSMLQRWHAKKHRRW